MIAWWWIPVVLVAGIVIGALGAMLFFLIGSPMIDGLSRKE